MKMNNYRLFLLGFVTTSLVLLTGFEKLDVNKAYLSVEKQGTSIKAKKAQSKSKTSPVRLKNKKSKKEQSLVSIIVDDTENAELQKTLDLSMPFNGSANVGLTIDQNRAAQGESLNIFATEQNKKSQPVYLDSQMLMSPEPEMDKRKSLDGAGIVINLKR